MVAINSLIPQLAAVLLFTRSTTAIPANALPRRTLDIRAAATSSGTATGVASSSGTTPAPKIVYTETNNAGAVNGCTSTSLIPYTDSNNVASTDTICVGGRFPISTNANAASSYAALVSSLVPVSVPDSGCAIGTKHDGSNEGYCTCAGSGKASASSVSTILAYSSGNLTTVCNTGAVSVPTNYVEVPEIKTEPSDAQHPIWADAPSDAVAGNCTQADILDARCWEALQMDAYVKWWWGAFNGSCEGTQFAQCFYKLMTPYSPSDCSILAVDAPCKQPAWIDFKDQWNGVRNAYVAWNLYNINEFFINYYTAIISAGSISNSMVGNIVSVIDPIKKNNVVLNDILTALSVGLAFLPGPEAAIGKALVTGAQQAPGVAKYLYPIGTADSQLLQMQQVAANLGSSVKNLQDSIGKALPPMVNDVNAFAAFTATGAFSAFLPPLDKLADSLLNGMMAYVISQAYQLNGVFITRQLNTSVRALAINGTSLSYDSPCTTDYDSNGVCDTFWYDSVDDTTYSFMAAKSDTRWTSFNSDMNTWFGNYTRPEIIFKGAAACAAANGTSKGSDTPISITPAAFNTDCLSNMRVCTWSLTPGSSWDPLFTDCSDAEAFSDVAGMPGAGPTDSSATCKGAGSGGKTPYLLAWRQYLGWGLLENQADAHGIKVCAGGK